MGRTESSPDVNRRLFIWGPWAVVALALLIVELRLLVPLAMHWSVVVAPGVALLLLYQMGGQLPWRLPTILRWMLIGCSVATVTATVALASVLVRLRLEGSTSGVARTDIVPLLVAWLFVVGFGLLQAVPIAIISLPYALLVDRWMRRSRRSWCSRCTV